MNTAEFGFVVTALNVDDINLGRGLRAAPGVEWFELPRGMLVISASPETNTKLAGKGYEMVRLAREKRGVVFAGPTGAPLVPEAPDTGIYRDPPVEVKVEKVQGEWTVTVTALHPGETGAKPKVLAQGPWGSIVSSRVGKQYGAAIRAARNTGHAHHRGKAAYAAKPLKKAEQQQQQQQQ